MAHSRTDMTDLHAETIELVHGQRTLVLATCRDNTPSAAPVYYLFHGGEFYFFSSPRALHIEQSLAQGKCAAAIFADSDKWEQIRGLQMTGRVEQIQSTPRGLAITGRFVLKFPFSKSFLQGGDPSVPSLAGRVNLYGFIPDSAFVVSNRQSFGRRLAVDPTSFKPLEAQHVS